MSLQADPMQGLLAVRKAVMGVRGPANPSRSVPFCALKAISIEPVASSLGFGRGLGVALLPPPDGVPELARPRTTKKSTAATANIQGGHHDCKKGPPWPLSISLGHCQAHGWIR